MKTKSEFYLRAILSMKIWEKIVIVDIDDEFLIERRKKSHNEKSYRWINPQVIIIDELIKSPNLF